MAEITYRDALNLALKEELRRDPSVVVWGEDVALYEGSFKVTRGLLAEFGEERIRDTPISENTIVGVAVGAAMGGLRPVVELMTVNFALLAMDQIINHMAKARAMFGGQTNLPMTVRMPGGGGSQLAAQHSQSLETYFMHCPGLKVAYPAFLVPFGQANVLREGSDVTIVSYARMAMLSLLAAAELEKEGISCEVIDLRTLAPLDTATFVESARKTGRAVVVEECCETAGLGGELAYRIHRGCFDALLAPVIRVAGLDVPMPYSRQLEKLCIPQKETIMTAVQELMAGKF